MAAQTWPEWLSGLLSRLWPRLPPRPGSHEARLEELRVHALLNKELRKPAGQRDEELVHKLRVETLKRGLENAKATRLAYKCGVWSWDRTTRQCCGAAPWATQRIAASYRALADFYEQVTQQRAEDLAAAEARRAPVIAVQPTLRLELPEALQQAPPRLNMCSECAQYVQKMELLEERCRVVADGWRDTFRRRAGLGQTAPGAAAASLGAQDGVAGAPAVAAPTPPAPAAPAAAAAAAHAGEAQQGERPPAQEQQQQHDCGGSGDGGADGSPTTPKQQQQQQHLHSSSDEEQR